MESAKKSMGAAGVFNAIVCLLSIVTFVLYVMNATRAYYVDLNSVIAALLVVAIAAEVIVLALGRGKERPLRHCSRRAALSCPAALRLPGDVHLRPRRVPSGAGLGSNLELGNVEAHEAATQAVAVIVISLVTWLFLLIAASRATARVNSSASWPAAARRRELIVLGGQGCVPVPAFL